MSVSLYGSGQTVIQVVNASYSTSTSTTSTSFVTSGLTATITPQSTNSKILVIVSCCAYASATGGGVPLQLVRGATGIYTATNFNIYSSAGAMVGTIPLTVLDSPATTSATTYTLNFAANAAGSVTVQYAANPSSITLLEIAYA
jgi:hypothetical protein